MQAELAETQNLNRELRDLYVTEWPKLRKILRARRTHGISAPYLVMASDAYSSAKRRLIVIGKETNTWYNSHVSELIESDSPDSVDLMMEKYRGFALGRDYRGRASFWTPVRGLARKLVGEDEEEAFVALNISKFDEKGRKPRASVMEDQVTTDLLRREIEVLQPHVVVFHTGPSYESWITRWFPGARIQGDRWLATVTAASLPTATFRSYHPQYLNRMRRREAVYSELAKQVFSA